MSDHVVYRVEYQALAGGRHLVVVDAGDDRAATVEAPSLREGFDFAAAVMRAVAESDGLERAFRLPAAPDGPEEVPQ